MIVDCFTFADELDMLECRLTELESVVDRFVLVEAAETFQGDPKPLHFAENRERFERWPITHVIAELSGVDAWAREASQREAMAQGLDGVPEDALIVVCDVDEIWRADTNLMLDDGPVLVLELAHYVHHLGLRHPEEWSGPVVARRATVDVIGFETLRGCRQHPRPPRRKQAGWHLSWFGGLEAEMRKLGSFSHTELADINLADLMDEQLHVDGTPLVPITTRDLPRWIAAGHSPEVWG